MVVLLGQQIMAWLLYCVDIFLSMFGCVEVNTFKHQGSFFSVFVEFHLPVFTSYFSSAVTIETHHPYQQGAFGCRAHLALSGERHWWASVFPWHDFGTNVAREAFTWLWQCFLGSQRPTVSGTSTHFATMGWRLRQSEIQLGEIFSCNWNEFTWETAVSCQQSTLSSQHVVDLMRFPRRFFHLWQHSLKLENLFSCYHSEEKKTP